MKQVCVRVGFWLWACLLGLGLPAPEVVAFQHPFEDYRECLLMNRMDALSGLAVYRTEQPGQLQVAWNPPAVDRWQLYGDTAQIRVVVTGAGEPQARLTSLRASRVVLEDVDGPGPWQVHVAVLDRGNIISDIAFREFTLATLERVHSWDQAHRTRLGVRWDTPAPAPAPTLPDPDPVVVHYAPYADIERHVQGQYHLTRVGSQVTATFTSAGSAVEAGTVLLTLPPRFRPATLESREVEGWPVAEGVLGTGAQARFLRYLRPEVLQPTQFRLQVAPSGEVRYLNGPVWGDGGPLAYMLTTTWTTVPGPPAAGDLCTRNPAVQAALQRAVASPGQALPPCGTVTGPALAGVTALELELGLGHAPLRRRDLAGLPGLRQLTLDVPAYQFPWWPPDLLAEVSGLQVLHLTLAADDPQVPWLRDTFADDLELPLALRDTLPTLALVAQSQQWDEAQRDYGGLSARKLQALLAATPELRVLTVDGFFRELVPELLAATPALRELVLRGAFQAPPAALLVPVPHLQHLTLASPLFLGLPPTFLTPTPELQVLTLHFRDYNKYNPYLRVDWPAGFLQGAPALRELHLSSGVPLALTPDWLDNTPRLEVLNLAVENNDMGGPLPDLPEDMLARVPQLHTLAFTGNYTPYLAWLRHAGQLRTLTLDLRHRKALPPDLLHYTPHLQSLELDLPNLERLPSTLLQYTPALQTLTLVLSNLQALPPNFLQSTPQVQTLTLKTPSLQQMPAALLQFTPQLRTLELQAGSLRVLSDDFLQSTPQLQTLTLGLSNLETWPDHLLDVPQLRHLALAVRSTNTLWPPDLLRYNSQLQTLALDWYLVGPFLHQHGYPPFPGGLLEYTPHLRTLDLRSNFRYLPADLLVPVPQLQALTLRGVFRDLPGFLLKPVPQLQVLSLDGRGIALPEYLLVPVPQLQVLSLSHDFLFTLGGEKLGPLSRSYLRLDFLPQLLQSLTLFAWCPEAAPSGGGDDQLVHGLQSVALLTFCRGSDLSWLTHVPALRTLLLKASYAGEQGRPALPSDFLAYAPQLQTLSLQGFVGPPVLGADLLLRAPALRLVEVPSNLIFGSPETSPEPDSAEPP